MTGWLVLETIDVNGVRGEVGVDGPYPGVRWRIPRVDLLGRPDGHFQSAGAFYDGADDHPEGAVAWAREGLRRFVAMMDAGGGA